MILEHARPDDARVIEELLTDAGLSTDGIQIGDFTVARLDGRPVGVAALEIYGRQGLLRSVAVHPSYRGHDIGSRLVAFILDRARAMGLDEVFLLTTTAAPYFACLGFLSVDRDSVAGPILSSLEFTSICPRSATCMVFRFCPQA